MPGPVMRLRGAHCDRRSTQWCLLRCRAARLEREEEALIRQMGRWQHQGMHWSEDEQPCFCAGQPQRALSGKVMIHNVLAWLSWFTALREVEVMQLVMLMLCLGGVWHSTRLFQCPMYDFHACVSALRRHLQHLRCGFPGSEQQQLPRVPARQPAAWCTGAA